MPTTDPVLGDLGGACIVGDAEVDEVGEVGGRDQLHRDGPLSPRASGGGEAVLPFPDLDHPSSIAVDGAGTVYIADKKRVLKLAPGSNAPAELPVTGLGDRPNVAVDGAGAVYVADGTRVVKLAAGSNTPTELRLPWTTGISGIAAGAGGVYVVASGAVFKLQHF